MKPRRWTVEDLETGEIRECVGGLRAVWRLIETFRPRIIPWAWRRWWRVESPWAKRALAREIASFDE